ncbi:DUF2065 family protein [Rhodobacterales bacterium HKCCE2091]|nr:DUF2065 family protein [Rhodobacterales bacterium HKCCE2091]
MTLSAILLGLGMVLVIEGLIFALAPSRLDEIARLLEQMPLKARRLAGLAAIAIGAVLVSWALSIG